VITSLTLGENFASIVYTVCHVEFTTIQPKSKIATSEAVEWYLKVLFINKILLVITALKIPAIADEMAIFGGLINKSLFNTEII